MANRTPHEIAIALMTTTIAESVEVAHYFSVGALPSDLRSYRSTAKRLANAGRDVSALAAAMEVLVRRS